MEERKKLLLLGGSAQQIIAIETAKRLGYETVLCDYLPDNPGKAYADKFYLVSTTDKQAVLAVALEEQINGILAYASDPAAPTAAFVAEKMGLPTNPYVSVETLCDKDRFRSFLKENGFNAPRACGFDGTERAMEDLGQFQLPVIIKPVDSSGSKGVTVLHSWENVQQALEFAFSFSRGHRVIIEECVEKKHTYLIGGDIFVVDGEIVLWGLMNCHRDTSVNPLVPVGKSYPLVLGENDQQTVRKTLQRMVDKLGIRCGAMNVELVVDKAGEVWLLDIGPRNGGNMIPDLLRYIFGIDVVELSVRASMGEQICIQHTTGTPFYATHNLHCNRNGVFSGIEFSSSLEQYILQKCIYKKPGDPVEFFDNASKALGIVFLKFANLEEMQDVLERINTHISVRLE